MQVSNPKPRSNTVCTSGRIELGLVLVHCLPCCPAQALLGRLEFHVTVALELCKLVALGYFSVHRDDLLPESSQDFMALEWPQDYPRGLQAQLTQVEVIRGIWGLALD